MAAGDGEVLALLGSGVLAIYAAKQGPRCPFHKGLFVISTGSFIGLGLWRLYFSKLDKRNKKKKVTGVLSLVRKNILDLEPYRCARDYYSEGILLDANENSFGSALSSADQALGLERYPDPYQQELKVKIAKYRGVRPEEIFVGVGSDEAIDLIMRIFCDPGQDSIIITPPTYGMYKVSAKTNDVGIVSVPLTPTFEVRASEVLAVVTPRTKIIFLCSPGNPTAKLVPLEVTRQVLEGAPNTVVVVDEAYIDFALSGDVSACRLVSKYPNLLVLQTLSKAFGLAGIRCGMAIGNPDIIQVMNNVKAPYNVSQLTSNTAHKAFENLSVLEKNVRDILKEKERVIDALQGIDVVKKIHHSDTNFVLFEVPKAHEIYKDMAQSGVVARFRGNELHCKDCIRLTIGKPHENDSFLELFKNTTEKYLSKYT